MFGLRVAEELVPLSGNPHERLKPPQRPALLEIARSGLFGNGAKRCPTPVRRRGAAKLPASFGAAQNTDQRKLIIRQSLLNRRS